MLETDPELDVQKFQRRETLCLQELSLPLEHTDEEQDEGLTWPSCWHGLPTDFQHKIASDKLDIPNEVMLFLSSIFIPPKLSDTSEPAAPKRTAIQHVTPPLLPLDPVFTQVPDPPSSSPTGHVRLLSEATNSTAVEAEAFEAEILKKDRIGTPDTPMLKYYTEDPMLLDDNDNLHVDEMTSPQRVRRQVADLKVEAPLTPKPHPLSALRSGNNVTKSVSFPENMQEYIPDAEELPSTYENGNGVLDSENDFDVFFENIEPFRDKADRDAEHEQLQEVDTTKRVEVPHIQFEVLVAPWDAYSLRKSLNRDGSSTELQAQKRLLSRCATEELGLASKWNGSNKEERNLVWHPFAKEVPTATPVETIQHDDAVDSMIGRSAMADVEIVDSASLAWKLEGLRILDAIDDEEELSFLELESGDDVIPSGGKTVPPGDDIISLAQKRKLEIAEVNSTATNRSGSSLAKDTSLFGPQKKQKRTGQYNHSPSRSDTSFMLGGIFSTSASLAQFMSMQSGVQMPDQQWETQKGPMDNQPAAPEETMESQDIEQTMDTDAANNAPASAPLPTPQLPTNLPPKPFIISSSLLTQRRNLVRMVQTSYPSATFIERDASRILSNNANHPAAAAEADLILSPSTGLLLTSIQKLKQRPLPGAPTQAANSAFQTRLAYVADKYENIPVLVSEGQPDDSSPNIPDHRDCDALASLAGFAATTTGSIIVITYVPGGEKALASWIVGAMAQHGRTRAELAGVGEQASGTSPAAEEGGVKVLEEEETLWELFMRRAGLNAFAAQVVLARLGKKEGEEGVYGPAAFVRMSVEERKRRFEGVLGGSGVLERVGGRVDQVWGTPGQGL